MKSLQRLYRGVRYGVGLAVVGGSLTVLHHHDWDLSSTGVVRFGRAAYAIGFVVADYKKSLSGLDPDSEEYWIAKSQVHLRSAERLRSLCCANGGCYIKVGQHIGALDYLLPREYVNTMKVLHSDAPQSSVEALYTVIKEDLGKDVTELFSSFDDKPLGAASLAQVHKAKLKDGTEVAVKVQHPRVKAHAFVDMATMEVRLTCQKNNYQHISRKEPFKKSSDDLHLCLYFLRNGSLTFVKSAGYVLCEQLLVKAVAKVFPEFQFMWLAEETKRNLPLELDFAHEADNCERVSKMLSHLHFLKVPGIYRDLTSERVLTMEYCTGGQVNDKRYMADHNISVNEVSKKLGELYSEMIFEHGYIHCDPHPGNVLVNKVDGDTQLVLLDHGLYQTLTEDFRLNYCGFWQAILKAEVDGIKHYAERMGIGKLFPLFACMVTARSWDAVSQGVDKQSFSKAEDLEIKSNAARYLPEISAILNQVPRQMLLIFKTNDLLRGIESTLETRASSASFLTMSRFCVKAMYKHKVKSCHTFVCRTKLQLQLNWTLFKLSLYSWFLWLQGTHTWKILSNFGRGITVKEKSSVARALANS